MEVKLMFEDAEGDKSGVQIIAKGVQEPKEAPSDSPTFDEGVLLIATWYCWSLKMQFTKIILLNWAYAMCRERRHTYIPHGPLQS